MTVSRRTSGSGPADVVARLAALPDLGSADLEDPEYLADCLEAFRRAPQQAAARRTRFNFTVA